MTLTTGAANIQESILNYRYFPHYYNWGCSNSMLVNANIQESILNLIKIKIGLFITIIIGGNPNEMSL